MKRDARIRFGPEVRREPLWNYEDLAVFVFLAIPCLLVGAVAARLLNKVAPVTPVAKAAIAFGSQFLAYLLWYRGAGYDPEVPLSRAILAIARLDISPCATDPL